MYFYSINTIKSIRAYRDLVEGVNYLELKFVDLDNINHTLLYGKKNQYPDTSNGETMNEFTDEFMATLTLCYDLFDYDDLRNDLFKILYRYHLEYNRRSYFRSTLIDGNFNAYISANLDIFTKSRWLATTSDKITRIKTSDEDYQGYDSDGNLVTLDSSKVTLLGYYSFNFTDIIYDNTRRFINTTVEIDNHMLDDFNAIIDVPQVYLYLTSITVDTINTIILKTSSHLDQITNVIIDVAVSDLSDDVRNKIKTDLSALNNIRVYCMIDSDDMSKDKETVINEIDDIYSIFENKIDGIYLKNIKTLDTENATSSERENYYKYYMTIKKYAHSIAEDSNAAFRYYILGRMTTDNVVPTYMYGKYGNPVDQVISYIGDTPVTASTLGDSEYKAFKIALIKNYDLTQLSDEDKKNYLDSIIKYCSGFYVTDQDNFDDLSNSLEDQQKYCEAYVDQYKSIYFTQIGS